MADDKTFTKDELDAAIAKAVGPVTDKLEELENKNTGLLDDLKKAQREARAAKEVNPADLAAAEDRAEKAEAALAEAQKSVKTLTTERDKAMKSLETESAFTHKLLVENGLREQLTAVGVINPAHQKGAVAILAGQVQVAADGDNRVAKVGDKALADFVKEWAGGDEGKAFVTAPVNSGGGSPGGAKTAEPAKTMLRSVFEGLPPAEQHAFTVKEGGKVVDAAA